MTARAPIIIDTHSVEETIRLGEQLGHILPARLVVALTGPLGAGKTHFVKGVARGIGERDPRKVTSPTFMLIQEYHGRITLYHIDAYRLKGAAELAALGFDELVGDDSVAVVEWADRVHAIIPAEALTVAIEPMGDADRRFRFSAGGRSAAGCLDKLVQ